MPESQWQLNALSSLHFRFLDGSCLVYDSGSGQTLEINGVSTAVLIALEDQATQLTTLVTEVAASLEIPEKEAETHVSEAISELSQLGLIYSDAPHSLVT